jgi:hypothetical protein
MNNRILLQSIALDLKRVAIGHHSGSVKMANRFLQEALKRNAELDTTYLTKTVRRLTEKMIDLKKETDPNQLAEDALLLSILFLSFSKQAGS